MNKRERLKSWVERALQFWLDLTALEVYILLALLPFLLLLWLIYESAG